MVGSTYHQTARSELREHLSASGSNLQRVSNSDQNFDLRPDFAPTVHQNHPVTGYIRAGAGMTSTPRSAHLPNGIQRAAVNGVHRRATSMTRDGSIGSGLGVVPTAEYDERDDDPIHQSLCARWHEAEADIASLFGPDGQIVKRVKLSHSPNLETVIDSKRDIPTKRAARVIDEDDYGDDDEEEDEVEELDKQSPLKSKSKTGIPNGVVRQPSLPQPARPSTANAADQTKTSEEVRKQLEEEKKTAAVSAKRSFQTAFYTFENDKDAMLEQQKLDDLDREVENDVNGDQTGDNAVQPTSNPGNNTTQGSLGSADLGASSLTLKHLIARIDMKRDMVKASDNQLRSLISEVRKGRSKWASEDRVGQEELYEAAEKVLLELKAMTDYVQPFLQRVSKREAPDYLAVIKNPMDIGTMLKKLKGLQYKSKKDFVDDLNLIWNNCLRYNSAPEHPFRKKALYMRKETDKITPLIPDVVVRDRAEVEAEERRAQNGDADDSDDDDAPIMASRGRKAPKKGGKGASTSAQEAPEAETDDKATPVPEPKPLPSSAFNIRHEHLRADSEIDGGSSVGFGTPPPPPAGAITPSGINGIGGSVAPLSQVDHMDIDTVAQSVAQEDLDEEDTEFKTWKQVTMRDRATAAAERNRLFRGDHLNVDEPALLRSKAGMRRWQRQQQLFQIDAVVQDADASSGDATTQSGAQGETLAEGIEKDEDSTLPDYYNPLSHIPNLDSKLKWATDSEGHAVPQNEEYMRLLSREQFKVVPGHLTSRIEANMRQMQDTRKICAKIGIVKQMQIQAQTYQNQFQKYDPEPFFDADVDPIVVSDDGPLMAPWLCRTALQRTVGKIFYHAGFEDYQPSALDAVTDLAAEFFKRLTDTFKSYHDEPLKADGKPNFTLEEQILHTLQENGQDLEALETYVKDDVERMSSKLGIVHERMKAHLADLLRPALGDHAGADGVGAFNDGSEQFVGGDFAEDLDEDFFGFRELGLAAEFGLENMSVPLHLLQNRLHSGYQTQNQGVVHSSGLVFEPPPPYEPVSTENLGNQIGLVQDYFRGKLRSNHNEPLVEDEDLPQKQRFPKPRLPPTGKISSPRKRPLREQQQAAKKKRKLDEDAKLNGKPIAPLRLEMPEAKDIWGGDPEKDNSQADQAMMSPESLN
ncbi:hypothetical protein AMS68_005674 [Peltaster fructicola]|uniref:Bromo domain-containing protein n=1 Tax=Peltaster fructicola TaxID=286661 RepID=A0A6H0XZH9_9PEZI|nr:hypothetical protein AMS68_005674 [Peltaster fructicola]